MKNALVFTKICKSRTKKYYNIGLRCWSHKTFFNSSPTKRPNKLVCLSMALFKASLDPKNIPRRCSTRVVGSCPNQQMLNYPENKLRPNTVTYFEKSFIKICFSALYYKTFTMFMKAPFHNFTLVQGSLTWRGSISTVDLLVLTSLDQLHFKLKLNFPFLQNNLS